MTTAHAMKFWSRWKYFGSQHSMSIIYYLPTYLVPHKAMNKNNTPKLRTSERLGQSDSTNTASSASSNSTSASNECTYDLVGTGMPPILIQHKHHSCVCSYVLIFIVLFDQLPPVSAQSPSLQPNYLRFPQPHPFQPVISLKSSIHSGGIYAPGPRKKAIWRDSNQRISIVVKSNCQYDWLSSVYVSLYAKNYF